MVLCEFILVLCDCIVSLLDITWHLEKQSNDRNNDVCDSLSNFYRSQWLVLHCVCIYIYIHKYVYIYIYTQIYVYTHIYIYLHIYDYVYVYVYVYVYRYTHIAILYTHMCVLM